MIENTPPICINNHADDNDKIKRRIPRQSNIELLRFLAMMLVLILHSNYISLGYPGSMDLQINPGQTVIRVLFEEIAIVAVNVFVLISGYFGIKLRFDNTFRYIYQCVFFFVLCYIVYSFVGDKLGLAETLKYYVNCFRKNYFIASYFSLMLLSPVVNTFFDKVSEQTSLKRGIILFTIVAIINNYFFQFDGGGFKNGYSCFHLLYIYCLGRYIKCSNLKCLNYKSSTYLLGYLICVIINAFLYIMSLKSYYPFNPDAYNSPFVIIGAVCLFMAFKQFNIGCKPFVNKIAKSAFAVFLLHTNALIYPYFIRVNQYLYIHFNGFGTILLIGLFILGVYALAFLIDQLQLLSCEVLKSKTIKLWRIKTSQ